jgi:hypothetical protein
MLTGLFFLFFLRRRGWRCWRKRWELRMRSMPRLSIELVSRLLYLLEESTAETRWVLQENLHSQVSEVLKVMLSETDADLAADRVSG